MDCGCSKCWQPLSVYGRSEPFEVGISEDSSKPVLTGPAITHPAGSWYGRVMMADFNRRNGLCETCGEPLEAHATHGCP